ncbi:MAG: hypothetical protein WD972_01265 [Candidatus Andersenbacteria bacterium]
MNIQMKKELGVVAFVCAFTIVEFFAFATLLPLAFQSTGYAVLLAILSLFWIACMGIGLALATKVLSIIALIVVPAVVAILLSRFDTVAIGGGVLLGIFLLLAQRTFVREVQNRIYYRTTHVFTAGLKMVILGVIVVLTALVLPTLTSPDATQQFDVQERHIEPLLRPLEPVLQRYIPGYTKEATIDEIVKKQVDAQQEQLPPGVEIPPDQVRQSRQELAKRLNVSLNGRETVTTVVTRMLNRQVRQLSTTSPLLIPIILVAVVFLTLRALVPFIVWPVLGLVGLILYFARGIGLVYVSRTEATIERLQL